MGVVSILANIMLLETIFIYWIVFLSAYVQGCDFVVHGGVKYTKVGNEDTTVFGCKDNNVYEKEGTPLSKFCFKKNYGSSLKRECVAQDCRCGTDRSGNRVVGGVHSDGVYPWMAAIFFGEAMNETAIKMHCAGAILNSKWIITARHCVYENFLSEPIYPPSSVHVFLGDHNISSIEAGNTNSHEVDEIVPAPTQWDDYALIKLKRSIDLQKHTPICLPSEGDDFRGMVATFKGWGNDEISFASETTALTHILQEVQLTIASREDCNTFFHTAYGLESGTDIPNTLCFGGEEGKSACHADNGGPLIVQKQNEQIWTLAGVFITVLQEQCGKSGNYGHALDVVPVLEHIKQTISSDGIFCDTA